MSISSQFRVDKNLPKADMHVHISLALSAVRFLQRVAEGRTTLDSSFIGRKASRYYRTLQEHHELYESLRHITKGDELGLVAKDYLEFIAENDGAIYAEISNSYRDEATFEEQMATLTDGMQKAKASTSIESRIVVTCLRDKGPEFAEEAVKAIKSYMARNPDAPIGAFGLVGSEEKNPLSGYKKAFNMAWHDAGLGLAPHVAEQYFVNGPDFLQAVPEDALGAPDENDHRRLRVGHGTLIHRSSELQALFAKHGICLEVCPSSNKRLALPAFSADQEQGAIVSSSNGQRDFKLDRPLAKYFNDISNHPMASFFDSGIPVCLGSDNPLLANTSIGKEYTMAVFAGIPRSRISEATRTAIKYANVAYDVRQKLLQKVSNYEETRAGSLGTTDIQP